MMMTRIKRYFRYFFQYFCVEKPKGLDFTMRNTKIYRESEGRYHGYSKTDEAHLRVIFESLSYEKCHRFLDVGCGKGVVLKEAVKYPFEKVSGIELQSELVEIANRNFKRLHLAEKIQCTETNALDYEKYGDYDTYFFFNPFSEDVFGRVLDKIVESRSTPSGFTVVYHNPRYMNVFDGYKEFRIINKLHDEHKDYETYILEYGF